MYTVRDLTLLWRSHGGGTAPLCIHILNIHILSRVMLHGCWFVPHSEVLRQGSVPSTHRHKFRAGRFVQRWAALHLAGAVAPHKSRSEWPVSHVCVSATFRFIAGEYGFSSSCTLHCADCFETQAVIHGRALMRRRGGGGRWEWRTHFTNAAASDDAEVDEGCRGRGRHLL